MDSSGVQFCRSARPSPTLQADRADMLSRDIFGRRVHIVSGGFTLTIPSARGESGAWFQVHLGPDCHQVTLIVPGVPGAASSLFKGPTGTEAMSITLSLAIAATYTFHSNGAHWIVAGTPTLTLKGNIVTIGTLGNPAQKESPP